MTAARVETLIRVAFWPFVVAAPDADTSATAAISAPTRLNKALFRTILSSPRTAERAQSHLNPGHVTPKGPKLLVTRPQISTGTAASNEDRDRSPFGLEQGTLDVA